MRYQIIYRSNRLNAQTGRHGNGNHVEENTLRSGGRRTAVAVIVRRRFPHGHNQGDLEAFVPVQKSRSPKTRQHSREKPSTPAKGCDASKSEDIRVRIDGGCQCRAIRYIAKVNHGRIIACRCRDCRTDPRSSVHWRAFVDQEDLLVVSGVPTMRFERTAAGSRRLVAFCKECSTRLYSGNPCGPSQVTLPLITAYDASQLCPAFGNQVRFTAI
jgi:hypothetical protein